MWGRWSMHRTFGTPDSTGLPMCLQRCFGPSVCARLIPALQVARLLAYAQRRGKVAQQLPLDEVCCKVGRLNLQKFRSAQPDRYPCIAVETRDNPAGKPYRVLDGKHRIHRVVAEWLMQEQQQPRHQQPERIYCSFIVFSVSEVVAAEALVLMPTWLLGRTRVRDGEQEQLDSGTVDCVTWMRHNFAGLGLPPLRLTSTDQLNYGGDEHQFDHTLHAPSHADVVEAARKPLLF